MLYTWRKIPAIGSNDCLLFVETLENPILYKVGEIEIVQWGPRID